MANRERQGFHVLIPAAGNGARAGGGVPKQYRVIAGKAILRHTVEKFLSFKGLASLRVVIDPSHAELYENAVRDLSLPPPVHGAATRKASVYNGLQIFAAGQADDIVLIHDAARPFLPVQAVYDLIAAMETHRAATLAVPLADTIVTGDYETLDRYALMAVQTPQAFRLGVLKAAHERFRDDENFTDDAGLVSAMGEKVAMVPGSRANFKITSVEDLDMAEKILRGGFETRTGFGYDVHAFDPAPAQSIRLGGIDIPHTRKLLGHSDADVILHALTDAILGAVGEGDIGQLFPPSDMQWKGADSEIFVREACRRLSEKGGTLINADITLIAESPKIGPHRDRMLARLSDILALPSTRIGLKATTSEALGFIGRGEGMAAQVVVSVMVAA